MNIDQLLTERLNNALAHYLESSTSKHPLKEAYSYAVLPAGKLFRPKLVWNSFLDLDIKNAQTALMDQKIFLNHPVTLLACAIEIHHAYTLVHDDLPAMDNDLMRRGKPSLHAKFGEWQAILVGDGLLNISYQLLAKINHPQALNIIKIFSHATGPKGLIEGQVLDLSHEMNKSLENLIRTHELKTARLIQTSLSLSSLLATNDNETACKFWRLGYHLGVLFQLLDDLMELRDSELSAHELSVNPYLLYFSRTLPALFNEWENVKNFLQNEEVPLLKEMIEKYLAKNIADGKSSLPVILSHIEKSNLELLQIDKKKLEELLCGNFVF